MQQDGNGSCCSRLQTQSSQGASPTTYYPRPDLLSSYITHLSRSHSWIKGFSVEHCARFDGIVHLCNKIKPSPLLPNSIKRTLRLIWVSVSSQRSCLFRTNVTMCFLFFRCSLTCPHCLKQSNTFDPFLCISLPIPLRQTRWVLLGIRLVVWTPLPVFAPKDSLW